MLINGTVNDDEDLNGTPGDDTINGLAGDDEIRGFGGNDTIDGGTGDDEITVGGGNDTVIGGAGIDRVSYYGLGAGVTVDLSLTGAQNTGGGGTDTLSGIEDVFGTNSNDVLTGTSAANFFNGAGGNDLIDGGAGNDTAGFAYATRGVKVSLAMTGAQNTLGAGTDTLRNIENLQGSMYDDVLTGDWRNNTLTGSTGKDVLIGGLGDDRLIGDYLGQSGSAEFNSAGYQNAGAAVTVSLAIAGPQDTGGAGMDTLIQITGLIGSNFNDTLVGNSRDNRLDGRAGADTLQGGLGNDTYVVNTGGDVLVEAANAGTDTVESSASWQLGANFEKLVLTGTAAINGFGNDENNLMIGNSGNNMLNGRGGRDMMRGGLGDDIYIVDNSSDAVTEFLISGTDTVRSEISFTLANNVEKLELVGGIAINGTGNGFANTIVGNGAKNSIHGGAGNDVLIGRGGADYMDGGSGSDIYVFQAITDSRGQLKDRVMFSQAQMDKFDLSAIDAIGGGSDNGFTLVNAFSSTAGELIVTKTGATSYTIFGDVTGDGLADLAIDVTSQTALVAGDFIL